MDRPQRLMGERLSLSSIQDSGPTQSPANGLRPLPGGRWSLGRAAIHEAPLLLGHRGAPPADLRALQDLLLRVARLADDFPQVAELDLNPVIARPDGTHVVDARVRIQPTQPVDPYLRQLG